MGEFIGSFYAFIDVQTVLVAEFYVVIYVMEKAQKMSLTNVWLERDFALVSDAFTASTKISWMLRNWWNTCLNYCGKIRFRVTHIFHEENACADKLPHLTFIHRDSFHWYNRLSFSLFLEFFMNRYNLPICRFCNHMGFGLIPHIFLYFLFSFNNIFSCDDK